MASTVSQTPQTLTNLPSSLTSQRFYEAAMAVTEKYSKALRKHLFIIFGVILYIAFVIMATVYYAPNYYACLAKNGTVWSITNSIIHAIFIVFLLFYVFRSFLVSTKEGGFVYPEGTNGEIRDFAEAFSKLVPYGLGVCILFLVLSYGILFFGCQNTISCEGCTPAQQTAFNDLITRQVNRVTPTIEQLYDYYSREMGTRIPIASCENYYNGTYRSTVNLTLQDSDNPLGQCIQTNSNQLPCCKVGPVTGPTNTDPSFGTTAEDAGPTLGQFYVMTSSRTCVVGDQYDGYMSAAMIRVALRAGARCLDFDLCNYGYGKNSFPIVTVSRDRDNTNMQRNFVRFEDVLKTIVDEWIMKQGDTIPRDPLFLHLNLRRGLTADCMNQIAYLLQYYLNEQHPPGFLLPPGFHYQQMKQFPKCLGNVNICTLFNRVIILVHSPHREPTPLLDGLINGLYGLSMHADVDTKLSSYAFQEMEWKKMKDEKWEKLAFRARHSLYYIETSFHPYSPVSETLTKEEGGFTDDLNAKYNNTDSMMQLIMYKQTINNDPLPAFQSGCQFIAMNLQNLDVDLKMYLSVFKKTSFVLKPQNMWPKLDIKDPPKPQTLCTNTDIPLKKMTTSGDTCYTVCVPPSEYDLNSDIYSGVGLEQILLREDTCQHIFSGKDYSSSRVEITDDDVQTDVGITDVEKFTYMGCSNW